MSLYHNTIIHWNRHQWSFNIISHLFIFISHHCYMCNIYCNQTELHIVLNTGRYLTLLINSLPLLDDLANSYPSSLSPHIFHSFGHLIIIQPFFKKKNTHSKWHPSGNTTTSKLHISRNGDAWKGDYSICFLDHLPLWKTDPTC